MNPFRFTIVFALVAALFAAMFFLEARGESTTPLEEPLDHWRSVEKTCFKRCSFFTVCEFKAYPCVYDPIEVCLPVECGEEPL